MYIINRQAVPIDWTLRSRSNRVRNAFKTKDMFVSILSRIFVDFLANGTRKLLRKDEIPEAMWVYAHLELLTCKICDNIFDDPRQDAEEHLFCFQCLKNVIEKDGKCPVGGETIRIEALTPVPNQFKLILDNLEIYCENKNIGCNAVVKLC